MITSESKRFNFFAAAQIVYIIRLSMFNSPANLAADPRAIPKSTAWNINRPDPAFAFTKEELAVFNHTLHSLAGVQSV
jgi:hypothetical protein